MKTKVMMASMLLVMGQAIIAQTYYGTNAGSGSTGVSSAFGENALRGNTGGSNTAVGANAMTNNVGSTGGYNVAIGSSSMGANTSGSLNVAVGTRCMESNTQGSNNIAMGHRTLGLVTTGSANTGLGYYALGILSSNSSRNVAIGNWSGSACTSGDGNIFIGNYAGPSTNSAFSNRLYIHNNWSDIPLIYGEFDNRNLTFNVSQNNSSRLRISSSANGISGLRFPNLTSANTPGANPGSGVLTVDGNGDVILVTDQQATGITNSCTTAGYVPRVVDAAGNLGCSAIFDDGANHIGVLYGTTPPTGVNFSVNGNLSTTGIYNSSDKRFKKDIKAITNALDVIDALDGKTYTWNKTSNPKINFDDNLHSGLLAQDLEKILPHVVMTDGEGMKSVNYIEIIPYLIEAIKQQQGEIDALKVQMSENFKTSNADLINLPNTKIIGISPNPSTDQVMVSFNIDKSVANAKLVLFDLNGNVLSSLFVNDRDNNLSRTFQKDNFGAGVYVVSLVVNGKSIDTKKIVFN